MFSVPEMAFPAQLAATREIPDQPPIIVTHGYLEESGVLSTNKNFDRYFLYVEIPPTPTSRISVFDLNEDIPGGKVFSWYSARGEVTFAQFCFLLSLFKGSDERFVCRLRGRGNRLYDVSAFWTSQNRVPVWEISPQPFMSPFHCKKGDRVVSF